MDSKTSMEEEERKYFEKCIRAFRYYKNHALGNLKKNMKDFKNIPLHHQKMLKNYTNQQMEVKKCVELNFIFILHMLQDVQGMFGAKNESPNDSMSDSEMEQADEPTACLGEGLTQGDLDRVYTTLRQFVRDWTAEGQAERSKCYAPIIDAVVKRYKDPIGVEILVPGAGLGRLSWEFAARGYNSEGNEFSIFMLIGSNFALNETITRTYSICPWVTLSTNNISHKDRIRSVEIPDVDTANLPETAKFSMGAGDFTEVYTKDTNRFDVVAASFFLDTAHNIIEYLELIYKILKPGGHLISLGPLLYHYAGMPNQPSIEITWEDVESCIEQIGFIIEETDLIENVPYIHNTSSMSAVLYRCKFLVAQKPFNSIESS